MSSLNFPSGHETQVATETAPSTIEYVPTGQLLQVVLESAPRKLEYVPDLQFLQIEAAVTLLNFPAGHKSHVEAPATFEYFPISHSIQLASEIAAGSSEYLPARQYVQRPES